MVSNAVIIPVFGMLIPIVLVPTILGLRQARLDRELEHAERMKAMELGRTLPKDEPWWSPGRICVAIGAGVPVGVFFFAWMASDPRAVQPTLWSSAGIVGLAGVVSGSLLANRHLAQSAEGRRHAVKPEVDADLYDVVGTRG